MADFLLLLLPAPKKNGMSGGEAEEGEHEFVAQTKKAMRRNRCMAFGFPSEIRWCDLRQLQTVFRKQGGLATIISTQTATHHASRSAVLAVLAAVSCSLTRRLLLASSTKEGS